MRAFPTRHLRAAWLSVSACFTAGAVSSYFAALVLAVLCLQPGPVTSAFQAPRVIAQWDTLREADWPPVPELHLETSGAGWTCSLFSAKNYAGPGLFESPPRHWTDGSWQTGTRPEGFRELVLSVAVKTSGWPLECVSGYRTHVSEPQSSLLWNLMASSGSRGVMRLDDHGPELPIRPLWSGLAANAVIYGSAPWLLTGGPLRVRRHRRVRLGLCAACAYPRGENAACTECGHALL